MNKELLKEMSIDSKIYENVIISGRVIPLIFAGTNGIFICIGDDKDIRTDIELYKTVKNDLDLCNGQLFLFRISENGSGEFYDHTAGFVNEENIYDAYKTCYDFAALYLSDGTETSISTLLEAVGA